MVRPIWEGFPLTESERVRFPNSRKPTSRRLACMWAHSGDSLTYVALSPCGRYAKVGRSWNPISRIDDGGMRKVERALGIGRVVPVRVYDGGRDLEPECHEFLSADRVTGEWYRVGPRLRILVARLDREFGSIDLRRRFLVANGLAPVRRRASRASEHSPQPQV